MKAEFKHTLVNPITYDAEGNKKEGKVIKVECANPSQVEDWMQLDQEVTSAMFSSLDVFSKMGGETNNKKETDIDSESILMMLKIGKADLPKCLRLIRDLIVDTATIEDTKLTGFLWGKISIEDKRQMLGEYIANFIMPSLLSLKNLG